MAAQCSCYLFVSDGKKARQHAVVLATRIIKSKDHAYWQNTHASVAHLPNKIEASLVLPPPPLHTIEYFLRHKTDVTISL